MRRKVLSLSGSVLMTPCRGGIERRAGDGGARARAAAARERRADSRSASFRGSAFSKNVGFAGTERLRSPMKDEFEIDNILLFNKEYGDKK